MAERRQAIDPAVAALLQDDQRRERRRKMKPAERHKADKDSGRSRGYYDIPPVVAEELRRIAAEEESSVSSVAGYFLHYAIQHYHQGEIDLAPHKRPSRSPRYLFIVQVPASD
jgi:hypothetical protein